MSSRWSKWSTTASMKYSGSNSNILLILISINLKMSLSIISWVILIISNQIFQFSSKYFSTFLNNIYQAEVTAVQYVRSLPHFIRKVVGIYVCVRCPFTRKRCHSRCCCFLHPCLDWTDLHVHTIRHKSRCICYRAGALFVICQSFSLTEL